MYSSILELVYFLYKGSRQKVHIQPIFPDVVAFNKTSKYITKGTSQMLPQTMF